MYDPSVRRYTDGDMSSVCNKELQDEGVINSDEDEQSSFYMDNDFSARRTN